jgi:hypothetical protein
LIQRQWIYLLPLISVCDVTDLDVGEDGALFDEHESEDEAEVDMPASYDNPDAVADVNYENANAPDETYDQPSNLQAEAGEDYLVPVAGEGGLEEYADVDENADYDEPMMGEENVYGIDSAVPIGEVSEADAKQGYVNVEDEVDEFGGDGFAGDDDEVDE